MGSVLSQLCRIRDDLLKASQKEDARREKQVIDDFVAKVASEESISVFELSRSGVVGALFDYLEAVGRPSRVRQQRLTGFVHSLNKQSSKAPFRILVNRVLGALSAEEKLPVQVNESSSNSNITVGSGLRQLAQLFKFRLRRASQSEGGADLRDYAHHIVLIEPLATMASIQEFLWPRVQISSNMEGASSGRRSQIRSRNHEAVEDNDSDVDADADSVQLDDMDVEHQDDDDDMEDTQGGGDGGDVGDGNGDGDGDGEMEEDEQSHYNEERVFEIDEDDGMEQLEGRAEDDEEDDAQPGQDSDEDISSGSDDVIEQGEDGDDDNRGGRSSFGQPQLSGSLPAFELDHDALAQSPQAAARAAQRAESSRALRSSAARAFSHGESSFSAFRSYAAAVTGSAVGIGRSASNAISSAGGSQFARSSGASATLQSQSSRRRSQKLTFFLNGVPIPHDCSVLSAVIRSTGRSPMIGSRLWGDVHTLTYSKADAHQSVSDGAEAGRGDQEQRNDSSGHDSATHPRRSSRLRSAGLHGSSSRDDHSGGGCEPVMQEVASYVLHRVCNTETSMGTPLPFSVNLPENIVHYVGLLSYLVWMWERTFTNRMPARAEGLIEKGGTELPFTSHKIAGKVKRQVDDPIALCSGAIPDWCFSIARRAPFLIPFETRRVLFQSTALGVARALHLLQTRIDASANNVGNHSSFQHRSIRSMRESEARIGRIDRQKVRIHRSRLLDSAIRVMAMYATHTTVLEVEYFDEVGTGLGPTLEFYTLASREVQRADLRLWRMKSTFRQQGPGAASTVLKKDTTETPAIVTRATAAHQTRAFYRRRSRGTSSRVSSDSCKSVGNSEEQNGVEYIIPEGSGLFPSPLSTTTQNSELSVGTIELFNFIGRLTGKALVDGRLLDLRFSRTFCKLILSYIAAAEQRSSIGSGTGLNASGDGQFRAIGKGDLSQMTQILSEIDTNAIWKEYVSQSSGLELLQDVDPQLARSLRQLLQHSRETDSSLYLFFTLPGDDSLELVPNGKDREVTGANVAEYVARVIDHVLLGGVRKQTEALLAGLSEVIDIRSLSLFREGELELLLCGPSHEDWNVEFLVQVTRCDHGFRHESNAVLTLFRVLSELDATDQRRFVLFVTGSPALPLGGLRNLQPRLTIVKRTPESNRSPDECLPTVMTCTNYLKLPDYSSYDIAKERIMYAIREGQGSFHLS